MDDRIYLVLFRKYAEDHSEDKKSVNDTESDWTFLKIIKCKREIMNKLIVNFESGEYRTVYISYRCRIIDCFKSSLIFYIIFLLGFTIASNFIFALCVITFLLILHTVEYRKWSKGHISLIKKFNRKLKFIYFIKDKEFAIEDDVAAFLFEKKGVWYKINGGSPFLQIKYHGNVVVKQFTIRDIDEAVIDKIVEEFGTYR
ncbi:MAG TPA: hypothetical protein VL053_15495 [Arachidicoccus sp.]|nr:hypothetical protein [Arachidicoccus sp.]